jgi:hypothetical protein
MSPPLPQDLDGDEILRGVEVRSYAVGWRA